MDTQKQTARQRDRESQQETETDQYLWLWDGESFEEGVVGEDLQVAGK